jgi:glycine hydroxymethyltransferase
MVIREEISMKDYLVRDPLKELDPDVYQLIELESEKQARKLIMIPSESSSPEAIREAMGSRLQNLYAEGYPDEKSRFMPENDILNYLTHLTSFRRYSDPRYYKGVEYADVIESLARRRCSELFATKDFPANSIFSNVQALSGAPANNAVYSALIETGEPILGMNLLHGGHLTHGSSINRSGKLYKASHYTIDYETGQIDYDNVQGIANEIKPKIIIAGYSSYPWMPSWKKFRKIADSVGAYLLADISHIVGMIVAAALPSPIGFADVIMFTTHKTLCGPRGACIVTTDETIAKKIDKSVFPGEQGGPHVQVFAALATTFLIAKTKNFIKLQTQILINCSALTEQLKNRGLKIAYGGSDTHLINIDCKTIIGNDGTTLSGDMAARILDVAGIICNRNTIPGDKSAQQASGVRLGTPWLSQRGLKESDMGEIADIIADIFSAIEPYTVGMRSGPVARAKVNYDVLEQSKIKVRTLAEKASMDFTPTKHGYPHYFFIDDVPENKGEFCTLDFTGKDIREFINYVFEEDSEDLKPGYMLTVKCMVNQQAVEGTLGVIDPYHFQFAFKSSLFGHVATWLRELSDGYASFDQEIIRRMPGPIYIQEGKSISFLTFPVEKILSKKPYTIGMGKFVGTSLPEFEWKENELKELRCTPLHDVHKKMGAKMIPFAGWEMPVWYSSVVEEHLATRKSAGLFDVSHMGVYQAEGPDASAFLDCACGNDISALDIGESCYTHLMDAHANTLDDCLVYHRGYEKYMIVVNASNDDKDWTWLNFIREGKVLVDLDRPFSRVFGRNVILRNLRDSKEGKEQRIDMALQGPKSRVILLALGCNKEAKQNVINLKRTELCEVKIGGFDLIVSRTGYTGERMAFELFVHPKEAVNLWNALLKVGDSMGVKPCGLGARDSLRTEAGLPLYGHEMAGEHNLGAADAGFGSYVKVYKPWFVGRSEFLKKEKSRTCEVVRFRFNEKGVRMAHSNDPVLDSKGKVVGFVTSCAIDQDGMLTGQAYIERKAGEEGSTILIYQGSPSTMGKSLSDLRVGDRIPLPAPATVLSRFPKMQ